MGITILQNLSTNGIIYILLDITLCCTYQMVVRKIRKESDEFWFVVEELLIELKEQESFY